MVQVFLFRAIVLTLAYHRESEDIAVKLQTVFRVPHDNGGMINAEEELLRGAMPFRGAFVRGKLQDFERVSIRIFEVKGLNARGLGVPLREPLGTGRGVFDLVLTQPAISALHVAHDDECLSSGGVRDWRLHPPDEYQPTHPASTVPFSLCAH